MMVSRSMELSGREIPLNISVSSPFPLFFYSWFEEIGHTRISLPSSPTLANRYPLPSPLPGSKAIEVTNAEWPWQRATTLASLGERRVMRSSCPPTAKKRESGDHASYHEYESEFRYEDVETYTIERAKVAGVRVGQTRYQLPARMRQSGVDILLLLSIE